VYGPNGSGKSTLVKGVTGLLPALGGEVTRPAGLRFGYLPQHRAIEAHWPMSAFDAAGMAVSCRRPFGWLRAQRSRITAAMRALGVDDLARKPFAKLSGGQQQRVLLAGVLADDPKVVVLDEPTEGLDARSREGLLDQLIRLNADGVATVVVSHEPEDLRRLCNEVAWVHPSDEPGGAGTVEVSTVSQLGSFPAGPPSWKIA
jgi:ABC-type Mn2+/Zn2+ transport system ATPase subunit